MDIERFKRNVLSGFVTAWVMFLAMPAGIAFVDGVAYVLTDRTPIVPEWNLSKALIALCFGWIAFCVQMLRRDL